MKKIILLLIFLFSISFVIAQTPTTPHGFHGYVFYSDGSPILESLEIRAEINGNNFTSEINDSNGQYDLVVESEKSGIIYFYLEGLNNSIGDYKFEAFEITELDFTTILEKPVNETNSTEPPQENTPDNNNEGGSSSGGGGGGRSPSSSNSNTNTETNIQSPTTSSINTIEDSNNTNSTQEGNQTSEETVSGITGAVVGFVDKPVGKIVLVFVVLAGVMAIKFRHKFKEFKPLEKWIKKS